MPVGERLGAYVYCTCVCWCMDAVCTHCLLLSGGGRHRKHLGQGACGTKTVASISGVSVPAHPAWLCLAMAAIGAAKLIVPPQLLAGLKQAGLFLRAAPGCLPMSDTSAFSVGVLLVGCAAHLGDLWGAGWHGTFPQPRCPVVKYLARGGLGMNIPN